VLTLQGFVMPAGGIESKILRNKKSLFWKEAWILTT
jgi:hypothetical protein